MHVTNEYAARSEFGYCLPAILRMLKVLSHNTLVVVVAVSSSHKSPS